MKKVNHEHAQGLKWKELAVIFAISVLMGAAIQVSVLYFTPGGIFLFSLLLIVVGLNTVANLTPWFGRAWIFLVLVSIFTISLDDIGVTGLSKVIVFLVAGLAFEFSFMYLKLHLHSIPLDLVIGSSVAMAVLTISSAFFISPSLALRFPLELKNLILTSFAVGLGASVLTFLLWKEIEHSRPILWLYFYLRR